MKQVMSKKNWVAGVDEAGRGPLAGPVIAAAVILDPECPIDGLADSKQLTEIIRNALFDEIKTKAKAWAFAWANVKEIDQLNILHASMLAMQRAVKRLHITPHLALIDGNRCPKNLPCEAVAIIGGDALEPAISAASIVAKVVRDKLMVRMHERYPLYGFASHKGYATQEHLNNLQKHGASKVHRKSFAPVAIQMQIEMEKL